MIFYLSFTVVWMLSFLTSMCTAATCYAEEGTNYEITCSTTPEIAAGGVYWSVDVGDGPKKVAGCLDMELCDTNDMYDNYFDVKLEGGKSTLTIKDVSRSVPFKLERSKWMCEWINSNITVTACSDFYVYVKPDKPVCDPPILNTTTYRVVIPCTTARVYPEVRCQIYLSHSGNETTFRGISTFSGLDTPLNDTETYYKSECTTVLSLGNIESYGSFFQIRMYPKVYSSSLSDVYTDSSHINLAIINSTDEKDDDDDVPYLPIVIALAAVLGATLIVAIVLAVLVCKFRQKGSDRSTSHELPVQPPPRSYDQIGKSDRGQSNDGYYQDGRSQDEESDLYEN